MRRNKRPLRDVNVMELPKTREREVSSSDVCKTSSGCFLVFNSPSSNTTIKKRRRISVKKPKLDASPTPNQRTIQDYFKSPTTTTSSKTSFRNSLSKVSGAPANCQMENSSPNYFTHDNSNKEIICRFNKAFKDDLRFPQMTPFSLQRFSCSSVTSCSKTNHQVSVKEITERDEQSLMFLVDEGCWYLLVHPLHAYLTEHAYFTPLLFRSILYGIVAEKDASISLRLVDLLRTHLRLHPPCRKDLKKLYHSILFENIKRGGLTNADLVKYKLKIVLHEIEECCKLVYGDAKNDLSPEKPTNDRESPKKPTGPLSLDDVCKYISKYYIDNDNMLSLPEFNYKKTEFKCEKKFDPKIQLQRLFLILGVMLDIMEENFQMWWMKSRYKQKELLNCAHSHPYIVDVAWEKSEEKGSVNECCVQIFLIFINCPVEYKHYLSRCISLLFQVAQANEENERAVFPFFSKLSKNFATELALRIQGLGELTESTLALLQHIYPSWLRFKVCGILLKSDLTSSGVDDLRSAYRIILRNLMAKKSHSVVRKLRGQLNTQFAKINDKDSSGETVLHKYCRTGLSKNISLLAKSLQHSGTKVNARDNAGWTPLHNAAYYNNVEFVKLLLKYRFPPVVGAEELDLFALNNNDDSPLLCAVQNSNAEIVDVLLENGAGPTVWNKNKEGFSAVELASDELKDKLINSWKNSISSLEHLRMNSIEIDILSLMVSSYCETYHLNDKPNQDDHQPSNPDFFYSYNYAQYAKDEKTLERLLVITDKLREVPSNPHNLNDLLHLLKSYC